MLCSAIIRSAEWTIDSCHFQHDLKVLPLHAYDIILGMDWLQSFSPMKIDWWQRWLVIPYQGSTVRLHGLPSHPSESPDELLVQIFSMGETQSASDNQIPAPILQLLSEFPEIAKPPTTLPPKRDCDHAIPLIEGARPVNVRPYRYPLALKDEIEVQVDAMLHQGIIQPGMSPFNSPVLLVHKKDGT